MYLDNTDPNMTDQYQKAPPKPKGPEKLPAPKPEPGPAQLDFTLTDPYAQVWLDDYLTTSSGTQRHFETPTLEPEKQYSYRMTVVWRQDGQTFRDDRKLLISAKGTTTVDYTKPAAAE
jgi:uncharacterized protein (TIGR03000 family)